MGGVRRVSAGIGRALRARWGVFAAVAAALVALDVLVPVAVLSLARKPVDYFTFNPWLRRLPDYLASGEAPLGERIERAWGLALFWFSANGVFGIDWGFAVTAPDLARFALSGLLVGAYFALWIDRRSRTGGALGAGRDGRGGAVGVAGAAASACSLASGGCTVMGCGAPVIPVVGLAFTELTSGTLAALSLGSWVATVVVTTALALGVVALAWEAGALAD